MTWPNPSGQEEARLAFVLGDDSKLPLRAIAGPNKQLGLLGREGPGREHRGSRTLEPCGSRFLPRQPLAL